MGEKLLDQERALQVPHQRPAVSEALMETIYLNPASLPYK